MSFVKVALLSGAISQSLCLSAVAREVWARDLYGWNIGAYTNDQTGRFNHCAAGTSYRSGIDLYFAIGGNFSWSMSLGNTSWRLQEGSQHPIRYQVDNGPVINGTARVIGERVVEIELLDSRALFQLFKIGRVLHVEAQGQSFGFNLTNSSKALDAALNCATEMVAIEKATPDPFAAGAGQGVNPFANRTAPNDSRDALRAEAAAVTANLLSAAKVEGFAMAEAIPAELKFFDAMWTAPGVVGGLTVGLDETPESALAGITSRAMASCKGRHATAKLPEKGGIISLKQMCDDQASTVIVIPRQKGGVYVVSVVPAGKQEAEVLPEAEQGAQNTEMIAGKIIDATYEVLYCRA